MRSHISVKKRTNKPLGWPRNVSSAAAIRGAGMAAVDIGLTSVGGTEPGWSADEHSRVRGYRPWPNAAAAPAGHFELAAHDPVRLEWCVRHPPPGPARSTMPSTTIQTSVLERFLRYVKLDTTSDPASATVPSTAKQLVLLDLLVQ